jgi:hypothetical protein
LRPSTSGACVLTCNPDCWPKLVSALASGWAGISKLRAASCACAEVAHSAAIVVIDAAIGRPHAAVMRRRWLLLRVTFPLI